MAASGTSVPPEDGYFKSVLALHVARSTARFRVTQSLFSSHDVDAGTRLVLRSLAAFRPDEPISVLDLGCGYGPIGIALNMAEPARIVCMVDRDALAVEYARQNIALNGLTGIEAQSSLGYDDLGDARFDLIALNVPAKAGAPVIAHLLLGSAQHLAPGGVVAIVVIASLAAAVRDVLASEAAVAITYERTSAGYTVLHYGFRGPLQTPAPRDAFAAGVYDRGIASTTAGTRAITLHAVFGLPEFDAPSFATELLMQEMRETRFAAGRRVTVLNPGQGHVPMLLHMLADPAGMTLVGRDLLSLRCSAANLIRGGCTQERIDIRHVVGFPPLPERVGTIAAVVREDEGIGVIAATIESLASNLLDGGSLLVAATSTTGARLDKRFRVARSLLIREKRRKKGHVVLQINRRS